MKTLVIENLPDHLYETLRLRAERHQRSSDEEVIRVMEQELDRPPARRPDVMLPPPVKLKGGPLTIDEIESAIAEGQE